MVALLFGVESCLDQPWNAQTEQDIKGVRTDGAAKTHRTMTWNSNNILFHVYLFFSSLLDAYLI